MGLPQALLDQHLYADAIHATGFSADKGARTSHFADHAAMLSAVRALLADVGGVSSRDVTALATDFARHATKYDGNYADRLSAAMAQAPPAAKVQRT